MAREAASNPGGMLALVQAGRDTAEAAIAVGAPHGVVGLAVVNAPDQWVLSGEDPALSVVASRAAARADTDALEAAGAQVLVATGENEPARVRSALDQLGALGVASVLLEGGPHLAGAFLDADEIDEIRLFLAPLLLGGSSARDPLEGQGVERISEALHALTFDCERIGEDMLISARLREW